MFEGLVGNSSIIGNAQGGAYFSHFSAGQVSALRWFGSRFEHNGAAGLILANGARDISVDNVSFVANGGVGITPALSAALVSDIGASSSDRITGTIASKALAMPVPSFVSPSMDRQQGRLSPPTVSAIGRSFQRP